MIKKYTTLFIAVATLSGCASTATLSEGEVSDRYPGLNALGDDLLMADDQEVDMLAERSYIAATEYFVEAQSSAIKGGSNTDKLIKEGQVSLALAKASAKKASYELNDVMVARQRALGAGAKTKSPKAFAEADSELHYLGNLVAEDRVAKVRESRQELRATYRQLEVKALKSATGQQAEERISAAKAANADKRAPLTFKQAKDELSLSRSVLEVDPDATDKAAAHAQTAYDLAGKATQITEVIRELDQSDMTDEEIVLWYQRQLSTAVAPVVEPLDFSMANRDVVAKVRKDLERLSGDAKASEASLIALNEQHRKTLAEKDRIIGDLKATSSADKQKQAEMEARFRVVQNMFKPQEAEVYRQGNNVLIRAFGFNFRSGQSEIQSENFVLLNKLTKAIGQFPASTIEVSGHTDNRGADALNLDLSAERAKKVASFMTEVGGIERRRIKSFGYGETRPLATNETEEGRASNRRVEFLIINQ